MADFNFDLGKGDSFKLDKSEGLDNITVRLTWKGEDLDLEAFLLGNEGVIGRREDFVFYNSENRTEPFSREKFGNKRRWLAETAPMSADSAVRGAIDQREGGIEEMHIDLASVATDVSEIVITASCHGNESFKDMQDPMLTIINDANGEPLCQFSLAQEFGNETAVVAGSFTVDDEGEWQFNAEGKGYEGGLQTLVELYA